MVMYCILIGFNGNLIGFYGDFMGFNGDVLYLLVISWDLMVMYCKLDLIS